MDIAFVKFGLSHRDEYNDFHDHDHDHDYDAAHHYGNHHDVDEAIIRVGDRVEVHDLGWGTVRYIGRILDLDDRSEDYTLGGEHHTVWYGIELDEPNGDNAGAIQGTSYFGCKNGHGTFTGLNCILISFA